MSRICIVFGTRPEIIKLSPIIRKAKNITTVFTGQHYDYNLGLKFVRELELPSPDYKLKLSHHNPARQMGDIMTHLSRIFLSNKFDTVFVQGDTNTVLASALSSLKCKIPVCHVEAGLRSFDWRMPEEHNRIATDHLSEVLFASTDVSRKNLVNENVHGRIFVVGNTIIDAIEQNLVLAEKRSSVDVTGEFALLTLHRAENVDDKKTLSGIINGIIQSKVRFIFPMHPRTRKRLNQFGLMSKLRSSGNVILLNSVGYFDMLKLMRQCNFIVTDSGGVQEEATSPKIRKKVLVVRKTTDRPEAVHAGFSKVIGTSTNSIRRAVYCAERKDWHPKENSPYGTGNTTEKILKITNKLF